MDNSSYFNYYQWLDQRDFIRKFDVLKDSVSVSGKGFVPPQGMFKEIKTFSQKKDGEDSRLPHFIRLG